MNVCLCEYTYVMSIYVHVRMYVCNICICNLRTVFVTMYVYVFLSRVKVWSDMLQNVMCIYRWS